MSRERLRHEWQCEAADGFADARVLVTGASGFIGWYLCEALIACGAEVYGLARDASPAVLPAGCRPLAADLRDAEAVSALVDDLRPDLIYHLAGTVDTRQVMTLVLPMLQDNLVAAIHLFNAAARTGCVRLVYVGSSEEASGGARQIPFSPYAAAKMAGALYARMFTQLYGLPTVMVRPFLVYGPGQGETKLVPHTVLSLLRGEPPRLASGRRVVDFIYVLDLVYGLLRVGQAPGVVGETVDLGSGHGVTIREAVALLVELADSGVAPQFGAVPDRLAEADLVADREQPRRLLGWEPRWGLREGFADTLAWYRARLAAGPPLPTARP